MRRVALAFEFRICRNVPARLDREHLSSAGHALAAEPGAFNHVNLETIPGKPETDRELVRHSRTVTDFTTARTPLASALIFNCLHVRFDTGTTAHVQKKKMNA